MLIPRNICSENIQFGKWRESQPNYELLTILLVLEVAIPTLLIQHNVLLIYDIMMDFASFVRTLCWDPWMGPDVIMIRGGDNWEINVSILQIIEGLYYQRPMQCLASSKLLPSPPPDRPGSVYPPPPRLWCGGKTHSLGVEGAGQQFGRGQTLLCTLYI